MSNKSPEQFDDYQDKPIVKVDSNDGISDNDDNSFDVNGALSGLLDTIVPPASAEESKYNQNNDTVSKLAEDKTWSYEFLPSGLSWSEYIYANAMAAYAAEKTRIGASGIIAPLELVLAIIKKESHGTVIVNSPLDVSATQREEGWFSRGDKFSLAAGPAQMIPSTARAAGLRVMYTRDEVSIQGKKPVPREQKDENGEYTRNGHKIKLTGKGWVEEGKYTYPIVDERTSIYHQVQALVKYLTTLYKNAKQIYPDDDFEAMLEVASYYNSGRGQHVNVGNATDKQRDNYVDVMRGFIRYFESNQPDPGKAKNTIPVAVPVHYERDEMEPISIGQMLKNQNMALSLPRFFDENGGLKLDIPLTEMLPKNKQSLKLPNSILNKARRRFLSVDSDGRRVWDTCEIAGNLLQVHPVKDENGMLTKRKSRDYTRSAEDEIDIWERPGMWELTLQDIIDLGARPSEIFALNPELNLSQLLAYRIPEGYSVVLPIETAKSFKKMIDERNNGSSEIAIISKRGAILKRAENLFADFMSSGIMSTGSVYENPFIKINEELLEAGMVPTSYLISEQYAKLAKLDPGRKRWVDVIKNSKEFAPIFMEKGLEYLGNHAVGAKELTSKDYVCALAIVELSKSANLDKELLSRNAETLLFADSLVRTAVGVTEGIGEKRENAHKNWEGNSVASALDISTLADPGVKDLEALGEDNWKDARTESQGKIEALEKSEGFTQGRDMIKKYIETWPKWDNFAFDFDRATFGYDENREFAGKKVPIYKSNLLMVPFEYKPEKGSSEVVAYAVFDLAKWSTMDEAYVTGIPGEDGAEVKPEQPTETPAETNGGSAVFSIIGLDGEVGEEVGLVMDENNDLDSVEEMLSSSLWHYYIIKLMGNDDDGLPRKIRDISGNRKLKYEMTDGRERIIVLTNDGGIKGEIAYRQIKLGIAYWPDDPFEDPTAFSLEESLVEFK